MLQLPIVPSKTRDATEATDLPVIHRLNARSLALSALLGTHPPALPSRALVALAELFGIAGGTMRTALSRMVAAGEIEAATGWYRLTGRLLDRQRSQDVGRRPPAPTWDGTWHTVIAAADQRELADRRHFRVVLSEHRFGELRPDTWLRPANLPAPELGSAAFVLTGTVGDTDAPVLAARLWDLPQVTRSARRLLGEIERLRASTDLADHSSIPASFTLAASVVRFLRSEPFLPGELAPDDWPIDDLRAGYDDLEADLQATLRDFLRAQRP